MWFLQDFHKHRVLGFVGFLSEFVKVVAYVRILVWISPPTLISPLSPFD